MGQKKIKTIGTEEKKAIKKGKGEGHLKDMAKAALAEEEARQKKVKAVDKEISQISSKTAKKEVKEKATPKKIKTRSRRYQALKTKINKTKLYPIPEAVELVLGMANSKMDETIELHLKTRVDKLAGSVNLPFGTGKKLRVAITDDKIINSISAGKIDFDILISHPSMMGKIAKVAKILGPKGLMPNPKNGTISPNPEEVKKKLEAGQTHFKTEPKFPLIHMVIGKASFGKDKIQANLEALIKAVKPGNIEKAFLKSTHSPSVKLQVN